MRRHHFFRVTGEGDFPWDMLRYDQCWPCTSVDVQNLQRKGQREVVLSDHHPLQWEPTYERWASFGWTATLSYPR